MSKNKNIVIIVLVVLLVIAALYIGYSWYANYQLQNQISVYQQGAQAGYEQAIIQVVQQAVTCVQVPLRVGNQTINIVAVDC